ncbi:MAG: c-type cytochrome [Pseudomonadota bacterium]|nr:c-type cytochrome [Pseudomonadota bacterium]
MTNLSKNGFKKILFHLTFMLIGLSACSSDPNQNVPPLFITACDTCHGEGLGGAPVPADKDDWERRTAKGISQVYKNAIDGFEGAMGIMPPKGSRPDLTDEQIKGLVDWMVETTDYTYKPPQ